MQILQDDFHARPRCDAQQDVSPPHHSRGAYGLRLGLLLGRDRRAPQEENATQRLALNNHLMAQRVQTALQLPPAESRRPSAIPARAGDPLDQTVSPPNLRLRVPPAEARPA